MDITDAAEYLTGSTLLPVRNISPAERTRYEKNSKKPVLIGNTSLKNFRHYTKNVSVKLNKIKAPEDPRGHRTACSVNTAKPRAQFFADKFSLSGG